MQQPELVTQETDEHTPEKEGCIILPDALSQKGDDSNKTNGTRHKICYGSQTDFQEMVKDIWIHILHFIIDYPQLTTAINGPNGFKTVWTKPQI
jgi:hypothetical protein